MGPRLLEMGSPGGGENFRGWGQGGCLESKVLVPGPQGWEGGVRPWTHGPEQKSRSRSPSQERPHRGPLEARGLAGSCSPAARAQALGSLAPSPARRTSQMGNCTWGEVGGGCRHRGVRPGPWPLGARATPASSARHPQKGQELAAQSKDNRTRQTRHAFPGAAQHPEAPRSLPAKGARVSGKA